jgi:hypothetical protein
MARISLIPDFYAEHAPLGKPEKGDEHRTPTLSGSVTVPPQTRLG